MAGYSKRSLSAKLGLRDGMRVALLDAPTDYVDQLEPLPEIRLTRDLRGTKDFVQFFTRSRSLLTRRLPVIVRSLDWNGMAWISWPKKSSGVATEVDEGDVRRAGLEAGLVDVKICAVDEVWSGLKFVFRLEDRPKS